MSDCEIGTRFAAAAVDERLLLRGELAEEPRDGVCIGEGLKEVRLILPPLAEARISVDRGSEVMDSPVDAARVSADVVGDSRVRSDGVFPAAESDVVEETIGGDGARVAGYRKGENEIGYASKRSSAGTGSFGEGSEEALEDKKERGQTRVSPWYAPRLEAVEASEERGGWMHGFGVGDMVWGKVKSHPWWPGHIFNEAFASSSVRRTKRDGHVLVAFFGDSSYGWFDPAELIPFDSHYTEKSKQTNSRNFTKAVEEAVDEANRRCALGLSCCCRNPSNFRATTVPGYFVVDVAGYEPGGVYSSKQIKKARDDFATVEMLSFVNQLAVRPQDSEQGSMEFIKKSATLLALRKAMFEEFDVTYAEAFGVQPMLPSRAAQWSADQNEKVPFRAAPLSGPLVIAEALGERKASSKAVVRAKDSTAKKNKYLFKRREEPTPISPSLKSPRPGAAGTKQRPPSGTPGYAPDLKHAGQGQGAVQQYPGPEATNVHYIPHLQADVVVAAADGSYAADVGNYVLQKRVPEKQHSVLTKQELGRTPVHEFRPESLDRAYEPSGKTYPSTQDVGVKPEQPGLPTHEGGTVVKVDSGDGNMSSHYKYKAVVDAKTADAAVAQEKVTEGAVGFIGMAAYGAPSPMDVEAPHQQTKQTKTVNDTLKKEKVRKHPPEQVDGEKKKKKKKRKTKEGGLETSIDHPTLKHKKNEESGRSSAGKSIGVELAHSNNSLAKAETRTDGAHSAVTPSDSAILHQLPKLDISFQSLDLPAILGDLSALALNPFYGAERNVATLVRHVFLRFRSLVYEKALPFPPTGEHETSEPHAVKFRAPRPLQEAGKENAIVAKDGEARESTKPPKMKSILKTDDPTKMGRKRLPSDRQEEKLAKRLKKLDKLKALASEKKAGLVNRTADVQPRGEQKDTGTTVVAPAKLPKADSIKKQEAPTPAKVATPTFLMMKFPQRTTLPSTSSLKARFARFGPLDLSGTGLFWKSYTCRVLFKHRSDAQSAYNYVQGNDIFGQMKVSYFLRDLEVPGPDAADPVKRPAGEARTEDTPQFRPGGAGDSTADLKPKHQSLQSGQLKSILKKPSADEAGPVGGGIAKEAPRVKFMLGGDDSRGEASVVVSSNGNGSSNAVGMLPAPALLDINRKAPKSVTFFQPLHPPLQPPLRPQDMHTVPLQPPLVPRAAMPDMLLPRGALQLNNAPPALHQGRHAEGEARVGNNVDISQEMLSLLTKCSEVVSNVTSTLGYVPYHPL